MQRMVRAGRGVQEKKKEKKQTNRKLTQLAKEMN